jgi:hypothetical protein
MESAMKTVAEDKETITIQFTRAEVRNQLSTASYVSELFEYLDREALDGYQMTMEEADRLAEELTNLTTTHLAKSKGADRLRVTPETEQIL